MNDLISRRTFGGVLAAALGGAASPALAQTPVAIGAIKLDLFELRDNGSTLFADWVQQFLPGMLHQSFQRYFTGGRGAETLHASIRQVLISSSPSNYGGRGGYFLPGFNTNDTIEGEVWLTDSRGQELGRSYLLATAPEWGGSFGDPKSTRLRVGRLCQQFAYWAPSKLGL